VINFNMDFNSVINFNMGDFESEKFHFFRQALSGHLTLRFLIWMSSQLSLRVWSEWCVDLTLRFWGENGMIEKRSPYSNFLFRKWALLIEILTGCDGGGGGGNRHPNYESGQNYCNSELSWSH
jgi:hypothetical protein